MPGHPQILTILASSPVDIQLDLSGSSLSAVGINSICEMNQQRFTAFYPDEIESATKFFAGQTHKAEVFSLALYPEPPLEPVEIQPYSRPMKGQHCFFSQQGELPEIHNRDIYSIGQHWPVSCTDQERAFCVLLERMLTLWQEGSPDQESRLALVSDYAARLDRLGAHNFKYWDGNHLYAFSSQTDQLPPLKYFESTGSAFEFEDECIGRLAIKSEIATDLTVIGNLDFMQNNCFQAIPAGAVACFTGGKLSDCCEQVNFWIEE
ncbi:MAG: class II glutamine amidotransferase [Neptuniibacter sp.]